jgi:hypothetical protein
LGAGADSQHVHITEPGCQFVTLQGMIKLADVLVTLGAQTFNSAGMNTFQQQDLNLVFVERSLAQVAGPVAEGRIY